MGPSKNCVTWGVPKILLERGNNSEKGGRGVDVEMGGLSLFSTLSSVAFLVCGEK